MWSLTDEEQSALMTAVWKVIEPYWGQVESSIVFDGEPMTIYPMGIRGDAPEEIRSLAVAYESIIDKGAIAVDSERIKANDEDHV